MFAGGRPPVSRSLLLRTTEQEYTLEDTDARTAQQGSSVLRMERVNNTQTTHAQECVVTQLPPMSGYGEQGVALPIIGVLGVVPLLSGPYLLVIVGARPVGRLLGHEAFQVAEVRMMPFATDGAIAALPPLMRAAEEAYLAMLHHLVETTHMYFSHTLDLTSSLQAQVALSPEQQRSPIWRTADSRFWWNESMLRPFIVESADTFILPVMVGFVAPQRCELRGRRFELALISRQAKHRAGTRFHRRGVRACARGACAGRARGVRGACAGRARGVQEGAECGWVDGMP
jgi:hypothetical protein